MYFGFGGLGLGTLRLVCCVGDFGCLWWVVCGGFVCGLCGGFGFRVSGLV